MERSEFEAAVRDAQALADLGHDHLVRVMKRKLRKGLFVLIAVIVGLLLALTAILSLFAGEAAPIIVFMLLICMNFIPRVAFIDKLYNFLTSLPPAHVGVCLPSKSLPELEELIAGAASRVGARRPQSVTLVHSDTVELEYVRPSRYARRKLNLAIGVPRLLWFSREELPVLAAIALYEPQEMKLDRACLLWEAGESTANHHRLLWGGLRQRVDRFVKSILVMNLVRNRSRMKRAITEAVRIFGNEAVKDTLIRMPLTEMPGWSDLRYRCTGHYGSWNLYQEAAQWVSNVSSDEAASALKQNLEKEETPADSAPSLRERLLLAGLTDSELQGHLASGRLLPISTGRELIENCGNRDWLATMDDHLRRLTADATPTVEVEKELLHLDAEDESELDVWHYDRLIRNHLALGRTEVAFDYIQEARDRHPESSALKLLEAELLLERADDQGLTLCEEIAQTDFLRRPRAISVLVNGLEKRGREEEAYEWKWRWENERETYIKKYEKAFNLETFKELNRLQSTPGDEEAMRMAKMLHEAFPPAAQFYFLEKVIPEDNASIKFIAVRLKYPVLASSNESNKRCLKAIEKVQEKSLDWNFVLIIDGQNLKLHLKKARLKPTVVYKAA